jgi:hypothetical protein
MPKTTKEIYNLRSKLFQKWFYSGKEINKWRCKDNQACKHSRKYWRKQIDNFDNQRWVLLEEIKKELNKHRNHPCGHHEEGSCIDYMLNCFFSSPEKKVEVKK